MRNLALAALTLALACASQQGAQQPTQATQTSPSTGEQTAAAPAPPQTPPDHAAMTRPPPPAPPPGAPQPPPPGEHAVPPGPGAERPAPPPPATQGPRPLAEWDAKVNDPAGAAAILAKAEELDAHPLPPDIAAAPSDKVFGNLLVLHGMTGKRVIAAMHGMATAIGGRCTACHVDKKFASDDKKEKRMARRMLVMAQRLNRDFFRDHVALSCNTCHRGEERPEGMPAAVQKKLAAMPLPPSLPAIPAEAKRADQVYKNLQLLGGVPPKQLVPMMQGISASLGVKCSLCHVPNDWASDDKRPKQIARHMLLLVESANAELFGTGDDEDAVSCWTCHRGSQHPQRIPGEKHED